MEKPEVKGGILDLGNDADGRLDVKLGEVTNQIDTFAVHNRLCEIHQQHRPQGNLAINTALAEYVESLGFPKVSHRTAVAFSDAIMAHVGGVEKKAEPVGSTGPPSKSPDSSESTSTDGPPPK